MKRLLITGGLGYLGGCLAEHLKGRFDIVLGTRRKGKWLRWTGRANIIRIQWHERKDLLAACENVDTVIHAAGMNAGDCGADPVGALAVNGLATARLLSSAAAKGVRRFIYISTAHIYGASVGKITEETLPVNYHPYATSNRAGEDAVLAADRRGDIEGIVVRLSNTYGAPVDNQISCWHLLINDLSRQAVTKNRLELRSSGVQRRDFIPMTDACRAIEHLVLMPSEKKTHKIYNVGGEWGPSVWEMACVIRDCHSKLLGCKPIRVDRIEPDSHEVPQPFIFSIDRLKRSGFKLIQPAEKELFSLLRFCVEQCK